MTQTGEKFKGRFPGDAKEEKEKKTPKDMACELGVPAQACQRGEVQVAITVFKQ